MGMVSPEGDGEGASAGISDEMELGTNIAVIQAAKDNFEAYFDQGPLLA